MSVRVEKSWGGAIDRLSVPLVGWDSMRWHPKPEDQHRKLQDDD